MRTLLPRLNPRRRQQPTCEAYNLVLEGNYYYWRSNKGDDAKAVDIFRQAINLDPALRHSMGDARHAPWPGRFPQGNSPLRMRERKGRARGEARIGDRSESAPMPSRSRSNLPFLSLGTGRRLSRSSRRRWRWTLKVRSAETHKTTFYCSRANSSGRFSEYIDWARRRLERDPLNTDTLFALGSFQQVRRASE